MHANMFEERDQTLGPPHSINDQIAVAVSPCMQACMSNSLPSVWCFWGTTQSLVMYVGGLLFHVSLDFKKSPLQKVSISKF